MNINMPGEEGTTSCIPCSKTSSPQLSHFQHTRSIAVLSSGHPHRTGYGCAEMLQEQLRHEAYFRVDVCSYSWPALVRRWWQKSQQGGQ